MFRMSVYAGETDAGDLARLPSATQLTDHIPALSQSLLDISLSATPKRHSQGGRQLGCPFNGHGGGVVHYYVSLLSSSKM